MQSIILQEAYRPRDKLEKRIAASGLGRRLEAARIASKGDFTTTAGRRLKYLRVILRDKRGNLDTLEILCDDSSYENVVGFVAYNRGIPEKTVYMKEPVPLNQFLDDASSALKNGALHESRAANGAMILQTTLSLLTGLMGVFFLGKWLIDKAAAGRDERNARISAERRLNEFLFQGQNGNEAAFESYRTTVSYLQNLINGKTKGVTLYGMPGTGKSYIVRRTLHFAGLQPDRDYIIVKGSSANPEQNIRIIYSTLYNYNGKVIVFDDFDSAMSDVNAINLLKAALDSYPVRIISLPDLIQYNSDNTPLPTRFEFTGRIVMITNMEKIDPAILSRTQGVSINFTAKEFQENIRLMLEYVSPEVDMKIKEEVYSFLTDCVAQNPDVTIDFRRFSSMLDLRVAFPENWQALCRDILYPR